MKKTQQYSIIVPKVYAGKVMGKLMTICAPLKDVIKNTDGKMTLSVDIPTTETLRFRNWLLNATNGEGKIESY